PAHPRSPPFPYTTLFRSPLLDLPAPRRVPDALPDPPARAGAARLPRGDAAAGAARRGVEPLLPVDGGDRGRGVGEARGVGRLDRSEEHTSELQSQSNLVC